MKTITGLVKEHLAKNDIKVAKLARLCKTPQSNMSKKLAGPEMDSYWIYTISTALKHDFFADLSMQWKRENAGLAIVSEPNAHYGKQTDGMLEQYVKQIVLKTLEEERGKKNKVGDTSLNVYATNN